jgi:phospholipid/cholesterol/gamma-HCH transport system substrate-binding protein
MRHLKEEIKAGLVILVAVLLFGVIVVIIGGGTLFERLTPYRVRFADATGLEPRSPVRLNGLYVGRVLSVRLAPDDVTKVEATIGVKPGTPLFDTTKAFITYMSLIGDYYLALEQEKTGRRLPPDSLIPSEPTAEFVDLVANTTNLAKSMDALLASIRPVFTQQNVNNLGQGLREVKPLMLDIRRLVAEVRGSVQHVDAVVQENRQPVANAVRSIETDLRKIELALSGIERLASGLDRWQQVGGRYADDILLNLVGASENLRALSRELKEDPSRLLYRPEPGPRDKEK